MLHLPLITCSFPPLLSQAKIWKGKVAAGIFGQPNRRVKTASNTEELTPKIKQMLNKVELSVSSYDTAWVAMVPSQDSLDHQPQFPKCLNWIQENQHPDGSWGLDPSQPLLIKDSLLCTLACVLALQKWNVPQQQLIQKGLEFVISNIWSATDKNQHSPIGFDIIFPSMIEYANDMGLNLPLNQSSMEAILLKRDLETKSLKGNTRNLAFVAEGLTQLCDWKEIMKYQRINGSLFNSPSTTAAALIHLHDENCFNYLDSLVKKFGYAVPTVYPLDLYARLSMIDNLHKLGIDRYFRKEIETVLSEVYRHWMLGTEEIIFLDARCCAMAFRLLRMNGYEISSDGLSNFEEQEKLLHAKDTTSILELFKASQITIYADEPVLDRIQAWTSAYLDEELVNGAISNKALRREVDYALKHPHANLERLENRLCIENYNTDNFSLLKTSYRFCNVDDHRDLLKLSIQEFNMCQSIHWKELEYLEGWVKKYGINNLKYARQKIRYAFFAIASTFFQPNFSQTRISWAKNSVLATVVDDFFDFAGSMEELLNLIDLIERWDEHSTIGYKSKEVEILFHAIYGTTNELADKARTQQGRCIKRHLIDIWTDLLKVMLKEAEWARNKSVPTMKEYLSNGYISYALGPIILISLYFLESLSEEIVASEEYKNLFMHTSLIGRLTNDRVTIKSESEQGKLNAVSLQVVHGSGVVTEEEARKNVTNLIESHRRELLRMVLQNKGSVVPKACKDLFWTMSKVSHLFYMSEDGYSSPKKMVSAVNAIINEPIIVP